MVSSERYRYNAWRYVSKAVINFVLGKVEYIFMESLTRFLQSLGLKSAAFLHKTK
jgi:IS1 family transposase